MVSHQIPHPLSVMRYTNNNDRGTRKTQCYDLVWAHRFEAPRPQNGNIYEKRNYIIITTATDPANVNGICIHHLSATYEEWVGV